MTAATHYKERRDFILLELLAAYSLTDILVFIVMLAVAFKAVVTYGTWLYGWLKQKFGGKTDIIIREKRDILLSAILLIKWYVNNDMFDEANNVIKVLESGTCLNIYNNDKDLCCCKKQNKFEIKILSPIETDDLFYSL